MWDRKKAPKAQGCQVQLKMSADNNIFKSKPKVTQISKPKLIS